MYEQVTKCHCKTASFLVDALMFSSFLCFSGHPAPQVIWYKDDVQLDRYCGLPKYEIFRSGQNHSLHIYKYVIY